jgi:hypothetical protein
MFSETDSSLAISGQDGWWRYPAPSSRRLSSSVLANGLLFGAEDDVQTSRCQRAARRARSGTGQRLERPDGAGHRERQDQLVRLRRASAATAAWLAAR